MKKHVEDFIRMCSSYGQSKPSNRDLYLYQPLSVHSLGLGNTSPWTLLMYYLLLLGRMIVFVVICQLPKMAVFIRCKKITEAYKEIELLYQHI